MAFPALVPSSRNFSPGDWPVKTFKSQDGSETRILYGTKRTGMQLALSYKNISDSNADSFLTHYYSDDVNGTYKTFGVSTQALAGYNDATATNSSGANKLKASEYGNKWRYASPPKVTQVSPGISNVQVNLLGVI